MPGIEHFWAVIPAGGAGTRLWPLSRSSSPKFLHDLTGSGRSLLVETRERLAPLAGERFLVVTGTAHQAAVRAQLTGLAPDAVLAEPSPRDSMAAVGLAAALLERRDPDAVMGSFAADHVIADRAGFEACVETAVAAARAGWLVTLGIEPTHPSSAFGYIHVGDELADLPGVHAVQAFVEKPDQPTARAYLDGGRHRWNAGMFVVRPGVLLDLLAAVAPGVRRDPAGHRRRAGPPRGALADPAADRARPRRRRAGRGGRARGRGARGVRLGRHRRLRLAGHPAGPRDGADGPTVLGDPDLVRAVDATGLVVPRAGRTVAVVGLDDVVVVDTPDALLVTTRARAQQVKAVVEALKHDGRTDLT